MPETAWLKGETAYTLLDEAIGTVVRQYRIDRGAAAEAAKEVFSRSHDLLGLIEREASPAEIARTRTFKDAVLAVKRRVYNNLRRYTPDVQNQATLIAQMEELRGKNSAQVSSLALAIGNSHASTRERLVERDNFYHQLLPLLRNPRTLLDVGSGMQPLMYPFDVKGNLLHRYVAVDKDAGSVAAVNAYARAKPEERLSAVKWNLRQGWESLLAQVGISRFDVAFLFKVVPVVERQEPALVEVLKHTPAELWVVTGSRLALTKRKEIERRERASLQRFARAAGRHTVGEISVSEEFGFVLEKG